MFIPYLADVPMRRWPIANWALMLVTVIVSIAMFGPLEQWEEYAGIYAIADLTLPAPDGVLHYFLLQPAHFNPLQLIGAVLIHAGYGHLIGNMLFLWVFGNALNAKLGHFRFLAFYFGAAVVEGLIYVAFSSMPSLGASGAIMGVVGAFVVLYPECDIRVFWTFIVKIGPGTLSAMWLVAIYVAFDIWGLIEKKSGVAYVSHVAGTAFGFGLMYLLIKFGKVTSDRNEKNLLQVWGHQKLSDEQAESFGLKTWKDPYGRARDGANVSLTPLAGVGKPAARPAPPQPAKKRDDGPIPLD